MDYDTIIYNVKIYPLYAKKSIFGTMFTKIGFITALFEEATPNEDIDIKKIVEVIDARNMIMLPAFVHYTPDIGYDTVMLSSPFNCDNYLKNGQKHISKEDFFKNIKQTLVANKAKEPFVVYNFNRDAITSCEIPSVNELNEIFKGKSYALFDKNDEYCIVSDKIAKSVSGKSNIVKQIYKDDEYLSNKDIILRALIEKRPNIVTSGTFAYLREMKNYGIKALVTDNKSKLNEFCVWHINSSYPIKAYITNQAVSPDYADLFPNVLRESLNPFPQLYKSSEDNQLYNSIRRYCGKEFQISDIAGELKKGTSCDYILTDTDIFRCDYSKLLDVKAKKLVIGGKQPALDNSLTVYIKMIRNISKLK